MIRRTYSIEWETYRDVMSPEIEKLLELAAQVPVEIRVEVLERECPDAAVRDQVTALLRYAEEAESYLDSIVCCIRQSRPKNLSTDSKGNSGS